MTAHFPEWDTSLFTFLNGLHVQWLDPIMVIFSKVPVWAPLYLIVCFFIVRKYKMQSLVLFVFLALCILLCDQLSTVIKQSFQRPRPCIALSNIHVLENCTRGFSFISNHAANVFGFAMFTTFLFSSRAYRISIFAWAAVVSYSRIYVGKHYPLDIIGGAIFGMLVAVVCYLLYRLCIHIYQRRLPSRSQP